MQRKKALSKNYYFEGLPDNLRSLLPIAHQEKDFTYVFQKNPTFGEENYFNETAIRILRASFDNVRSEKKPSFVTYKEFEELKNEVNELKQIIGQNDNFNAEPQKQAFNEAFSQLRKIKAIKQIQPVLERERLLVLVTMKNSSAKLLKTIAQVEINLAKKYPNLQIEIRPVDDNELNEERKNFVDTNESI